MALYPRFRLSLLATACAALAASALAYGQAAAAQQEQNAKPALPTPTENGLGTQDWLGQHFAYSSFIVEVGGEEVQVQWDIQQRKEPVHARTDYCKILGIREDEQQAMRTILIDAHQRINEIRRQYIAGRRELDRNYSAEQAAKIEALGGQRPKIVEETIAKLKQELGKDDFKKLDDYIYRTGRPRNFITLPTPPAMSPNSGQVRIPAAHP